MRQFFMPRIRRKTLVSRMKRMKKRMRNNNKTIEEIFSVHQDFEGDGDAILCILTNFVPRCSCFILLILFSLVLFFFWDCNLTWSGRRKPEEGGDQEEGRKEDMMMMLMLLVMMMGKKKGKRRREKYLALGGKNLNPRKRLEREKTFAPSMKGTRWAPMFFLLMHLLCILFGRKHQTHQCSLCLEKTCFLKSRFVSLPSLASSFAFFWWESHSSRKRIRENLSFLMLYKSSTKRNPTRDEVTE